MLVHEITNLNPLIVIASNLVIRSVTVPRIQIGFRLSARSERRCSNDEHTLERNAKSKGNHRMTYVGTHVRQPQTAGLAERLERNHDFYELEALVHNPHQIKY